MQPRVSSGSSGEGERQFGGTEPGWSWTFGSGCVSLPTQSCSLPSGALAAFSLTGGEALRREMKEVREMALWADEGPGSSRPLLSARWSPQQVVLTH